MSKTDFTDKQHYGLRSSTCGPLLLWIYKYRRLRKLSLSIAFRLEGGRFHSRSLRMILKKYHGIQVGAYSYGECLNPGSFPNGVTVGRYVSIGGGVRIFLRNHPMDRLSMHPFFYNKYLGFVKEDTIGTGNMEIGHDAWIGERAVITSGCTHVGIGAVIGASSVVTKDVPDFAIVAGNPARIIRYRFPEEIRKLVLESRWWELSIDEIAMHMNHMVKSIRNGTTSHPLLHEIKLKGKYCEH